MAFEAANETKTAKSPKMHDTLPFPHEVRQKVYAQTIDGCLDPSTHLLDREGFKSISNLLHINKTTFLEFSKLLFATATFNGTERKNVTVTDGLDSLERAHHNLRAIVVFPGRDEPSVLPAVHERLTRKLLATLCLGKLKTSVEYLLPDNREVTFTDPSSGRVDNVAITKGIPEHIASHVQLDHLTKLEAFRYSSEEYKIWTFEPVDKTWFLASISHTVTGFIALVGHVARLQDLWVKVDDAAIKKARAQEQINIQQAALYNVSYKHPLPGFVKDFEERRQREMTWPWKNWLNGESAGRPKKKSWLRKADERAARLHHAAEDARNADETGDVDVDTDEIQVTGDGVERDGEPETGEVNGQTVAFIEPEHDVVEANVSMDAAAEKVETATTDTMPKAKKVVRKYMKNLGKEKASAAPEVETKKQNKPRKKKYKKNSGPVTAVEDDAEPDTYDKGVAQMKNLMAQHFAVAEAESDGEGGGVAAQKFIAAKLPAFVHV